MLYFISKSVLVVVDIQGNLAATMHKKEELYANVMRLIQAACILEIPIVVTEQVPDKLGETISEIKQHVPTSAPIFAKDSFSCWENAAFKEYVLELSRSEIILCGIEAHVCLSQTALQLLSDDFRVACIADGISARTESNKSFGLQRMASAGADMLSTEMIVTEWLRTSQHPSFRDVLKLIK